MIGIELIAVMLTVEAHAPADHTPSDKVRTPPSAEVRIVRDCAHEEEAPQTPPLLLRPLEGSEKSEAEDPKTDGRGRRPSFLGYV